MGNGIVTLTGDTGGLTLRGGTAASNNLNLLTTSNATKGLIQLGSGPNAVYDEANNNFISANLRIR